MPLVKFKFKRPNASSRLEFFDALPSWEDLSSRITNMFHIPTEDVGVAYVETATLAVVVVADEQGLQRYYTSLGQSGDVKFVIHDMRNPDSSITIASTWSGPDLSDDKLTLFCWAIGTPVPFSVTVRKEKNIDELRVEINKTMMRKGPHYELELWQLNPPIHFSKLGVLQGVQRPGYMGCINLNPCDNLERYFSSPPRDHVHIIVQPPADASRKRLRSSTAEEADAPKRIRTVCAGADGKRWAVDEAIHDSLASYYYYVDPAEQIQTKSLIDAVTRGEFRFLSGARASGKTTRLFRLRELLEDEGYCCLYFSFKFVNYVKNIDDLWASIGARLQRASPHLIPTEISSSDTFHEAFAKREWDRPVVLLIDELSGLSRAPSEIRDSFLFALREVRHNKRESAITSVIAAGTLSVTHLNTTNPLLSPFNVADTIQTPYFSLDETRQLFNMFQRDHDVVIESAVVNDIWEISSGHPGMVCLCGTILSNHLVSLLDDASATISFSKWQRYPIEELYEEIFVYSKFRRMIESLCRDTAQAAVKLYRYRFAGFLESVKVTEDDEGLADFLTSEGVLSRPVPHERKYRVTSPLIDALVRLKVIPRQFPNVPESVLLPEEIRPNVLDIPVILTECLKCFDEELIRSAYSFSYKVSTVPVRDSSGVHVPRESVYDTELMRILCNWLNTYGWSVNGQPRHRDTNGAHGYSDIVLQKGDTKIVLNVLATGNADLMTSRIKGISECVALHSAVEGWVIHFTCEDPFTPARPELRCGVNVVYVSHKEDLTDVTLRIYSKDTQEEKVLRI